MRAMNKQKLSHLAPILILQSLLLLLNPHYYHAEAAKGFIRTKELNFVLNGKPFFANGFNAYWLMTLASDPSQIGKVSSALRDASSHGLHVARTWAFSDGGFSALQYSPGKYKEKTFKGLDFVISEARRYGIRLILTLANNYDTFGGKKQYVQWARNQGQHIASDDEFFTNLVVRGFYKNHVKIVLTRVNTINGIPYKNDPTIFAWELMNEPRCSSDSSGNTIQGWIGEMAAYVKSIDRNHLLEVGLEGFYGSSSAHKQFNPSTPAGTDFIANNLIPNIDFATIHSYPDQWLANSNDKSQLTFLSRWLDVHIQDAKNVLRKPLLITEFGKSWKDAGFNIYQRDAVFTTVYSKIYWSARTGGSTAGGLFWQLLSAGMDSYRDGYEVILSEATSTSRLITLQSRRLRYLGKVIGRERGNDGKLDGSKEATTKANGTRN